MLAFLSARVALALHFTVWVARPTLLHVDSCVKRARSWQVSYAVEIAAVAEAFTSLIV
jgi:hypothetical protein